MHYPKNYTTIYNNEAVAFNVGGNTEETSDSYSVSSFYKHNHDTDEITQQHEVIKNWSYNEIPKTGKIEGRKYRETVFKGSIKECHDFIANLISYSGHWINDPEQPFRKIFVEPVIID